MLFGTEAPGSGGTLNPATGKSSDHLVELIGALPFLSEEEKIGIFNTQPASVFPALARM
jgi:4-oxalmesaconate hydratase